jgi:hypothetical protein
MYLTSHSSMIPSVPTQGVQSCQPCSTKSEIPADLTGSTTAPRPQFSLLAFPAHRPPRAHICCFAQMRLQGGCQQASSI